MSKQCPRNRPIQHSVEVDVATSTSIEPQPAGPGRATLPSELTVYTTERVERTYGTGVQEIVLRAFGDALERVGAAYALGTVATESFPVPEGVVTTGDLLDAFREFLPTARTSTRCNLLVVDEDAYDGGEWASAPGGTPDLGGLAVARGARAISRDLSIDGQRFGRSPGDRWLNRCLLAAASVYGVSPGQGRIYRNPDRHDGRVATPAVTGDSLDVDLYDHSFADDAGETLRRTV